MIPSCDLCGYPLAEIYSPEKGWGIGGCPACERAERLQVFISEGPAIRFRATKTFKFGKYPDREAGFDYVEIKPTEVQNYHYSGVMSLIEEDDIGVVAVFRHLGTGVLYGQPV